MEERPHNSPRHGFLDVVRRAAAYLEDEPRVSLRALSREFGLDDAALEELARELVEVRRVAIIDGAVLVSTRAAASPPTNALLGAIGIASRDLPVLFCDLVGSPELSTQLASEDYAEQSKLGDRGRQQLEPNSPDGCGHR